MKKQGFTLIELIAVMTLIVIILIITIPTINNIIYSVRLNSFVASEKMMIWATKNYFSTSENLLLVDIGSTIEVKLSTLQSNGLISDIQDPWDNKDTCDGYILVTKIDASKYDYTPYLKCQSNYKADSYMADKLVAYWKLDGNAYNYIPNQTQGTMHNVVATTNQYGAPNKALRFNGPSNYVDTNYGYSLTYGIATTFSLWVNFSTIDTGGKVKNIFGKNSWEYLLSQVNDKIRFTQWDSKGEYAIQLISNTNFQPHKWYNIVLIYNGLEMYLYINGVIDSHGSIIGSSFRNRTESLKIGRGYPDVGAASSTFFVGIIDNLCVYNRAWSPYEVKLNYDVNNLIRG